MEKKNILCSLLFWLLVCDVLRASFGQELAASSSSSVRSREFDYFALSLQWPGTICRHTHHCCPNNGCCRSEPLSTFTIHGLWPDYDDGSWPACCSHTSFDMDKILPLKPTLDKYWPSLYCSSSSTCFHGKGPFWAHEWEKHGTCSFPVIQDEYEYFSTVLDLYNKHNVTEMLANAGILITNCEKYALRDVMDAIEYAFGASPQIVCKRGSVQELRLCFYKNFVPRDCVIRSATADNLSKRRHCPRYITLPTYQPLVLANTTTGEIITAVHNDEMLASLDTT